MATALSASRYSRRSRFAKRGRALAQRLGGLDAQQVQTPSQFRRQRPSLSSPTRHRRPTDHLLHLDLVTRTAADLETTAIQQKAVARLQSLRKGLIESADHLARVLFGILRGKEDDLVPGFRQDGSQVAAQQASPSNGRGC